ncbi:MAG TPA: exonuclease [Elusimicrobia bacterium]|nr:MAG: exonuclease [Elusimicrobia bacterium GWA2_66_18]HAZ07970.1 exonuclease [Elusimicrobiota bacterium]
MSIFVAIDFETADSGYDSACSVGLVRVENGAIVQKVVEFIQPPRFLFEFTHIHGIDWSMVADKPSFGEIWPKLAEILHGADFMAAHHAPFDNGVLTACCKAAKLPKPPHRFVDTVKLARDTWRIYPTKLPDVCRRLSIALNHHEALSDAEACAQIVIAAQKQGVKL